MGKYKGAFLVLLVGVLWIVIGLVFEVTILSQAATAGASANIGSFSGAQSINDLIPLIYNMVLAIGGVGLIGSGIYMGYSAAKG